MPMDGLTVGFAARELNETLRGGRIDKITQPERDAVMLVIRAGGVNHRLLLCASPNNARCHLTMGSFSNPLEPPALCMLMRKQLTGARITEIRQVGGDRIVYVDMDAVNELGDHVLRRLVLEIMGRHSNLLLLDENGRILEATRHVNMEMSRVRQIQPGIDGSKNSLFQERWINGVLDSGTEKSSVITRNVQNEIIAVGTMKPDVGTGTFRFPVDNPIISCPWGCYYGHRGTDVQNRYNLWGKVLAADRGVIMKIGYDAYKSQDLVNILMTMPGGRNSLEPYKQTYGNFNLPVDSFEMLAFNNPVGIVFNGNPINAYCLSNCVLDVDNLENRKPVKMSPNAKIDGVITMLMCLGMLNSMTRRVGV